jgi:3',5'-cyclic AMP phosphodiesterase CpdA
VRTIVHLSDLHFGRIHGPTLQPLIRSISEIEPDLVAVSGDLTQRARVNEFKEARAFLDALPSPKIVVPGNHDVPLYNPLLRLLQPLERFKRYITDELSPMHIDDEIAVLGVNTARALAVKGGRINKEQIAGICAQLCGLAEKLTKIIVTHHPFDVPEGFGENGLVGQSRRAMEQFAKCGVDVFLAGHLHRTYAATTAARYNVEGFSALIIQAGTATSSRGRGESNSFNVIRIAPPAITLEKHTWQADSEKFSVSETGRFRHLTGGWIRA